MKDQNVETLEELLGELTTVDEVNKTLAAQLNYEKQQRLSVSRQLDLSKELVLLLEKKINIEDLENSADE